MEGVPAALWVLYVEIDGGMFDESLDKVAGSGVGRGGGAQENCEAGMVAAVDFGLSNMGSRVL